MSFSILYSKGLGYRVCGESKHERLGSFWPTAIQTEDNAGIYQSKPVKVDIYGRQK